MKILLLIFLISCTTKHHPEGPAIPLQWSTLKELNYESGKVGENLQKMKDAYVVIPGFVVPLSDGDTKVREFLLVPFMMACVHVPPPPPNQMILVKMEDPVDMSKFNGPVNVMGYLKIIDGQSQYGRAGFELDGLQVEEYKYDK